jgi:Mycobacterium membrane protein
MVSRHAGRLTAAAALVLLLVVGLIVQNHNKHVKKLAGHQVVYTVTTTGSGGAYDINYSTAGGSQQAANVPTPWTYSAALRAIGAQAALVLTAQNSPASIGSITCTITVDGVVAASNTSSGAASVVTCTTLIR